MPDHKAFALALIGLLRRHEAEWPADVRQAVQGVQDALRSGDAEYVQRASAAASAIYATAHATRNAYAAAYATAHAAYAAYAASYAASATRNAKRALPEAEHPAVDALVALYLR